MPRLIDADALMEKLNVFNDREHGNEHFLYGIETAKELLEDTPTTTEADISAMAIDEFLEKISLEISESIIWDMVVTAHRNGNCSETSDEIVEYVLDTVREVAEQLKEE